MANGQKKNNSKQTIAAKQLAAVQALSALSNTLGRPSGSNSRRAPNDDSHTRTRTRVPRAIKRATGLEATSTFLRQRIVKHGVMVLKNVNTQTFYLSNESAQLDIERIIVRATMPRLVEQTSLNTLGVHQPKVRLSVPLTMDGLDPTVPSFQLATVVETHWGATNVVVGDANFAALADKGYFPIFDSKLGRMLFNAQFRRDDGLFPPADITAFTVEFEVEMIIRTPVESEMTVYMTPGEDTTMVPEAERCTVYSMSIDHGLDRMLTTKRRNVTSQLLPVLPNGSARPHQSLLRHRDCPRPSSFSSCSNTTSPPRRGSVPLDSNSLRVTKRTDS